MLECAGSSLDEVAKVTIYMVDLGEPPEMNDVLNRDSAKDPPARMISKHLRLVAGARVEIEAIAFVE